MTDIKLIINQDVYKDNIATPTILLFIFGGGLFITSIILRLIFIAVCKSRHYNLQHA